MSAERVPEDPPLSFEAFASRVRNRPSMVVIRDWLARSAEGELVARAFIVRFEADTNRHLRETGIDVLPAHRRKGIAKQLFRELVASAGEADDIVLAFFTNDRVASTAAFLDRIGAKTTLTMHTNQLELSQLDHAMVREWAAIETKGYRLEWIDGDVPEDQMNNVIVAYDTMNTARAATRRCRTGTRLRIRSASSTARDARPAATVDWCSRSTRRPVTRPDIRS